MTPKEFQCSPSRAWNLILGTLNLLLEGFKLRSRTQDQHKKSSVNGAHTEMQRRFEEVKQTKSFYCPITNLRLPTTLAFAVQKARGEMMPHDVFRSSSPARRTKGVLVMRTGGLRTARYCFARSARRPVG